MKVYNRFSKKAIKKFMYDTSGHTEYWQFMRAMETLHNFGFIDDETWRYILDTDCHLFNSRR